MTFEERYVKVTITIEDAEIIRTITVPKAREIDVHYMPQQMFTRLPDLDEIFPNSQRSAGFQIRGISDYDYASQRLVIVETEIKNQHPVPGEEKHG